MRRSYAVVWGGKAGRAELSERGLELTSRESAELIPFADMPGITLTAGALQIGGLTLRSLDAPGALRELADRVAARLGALRRP